jgi:Bacterial SH3 domain
MTFGRTAAAAGVLLALSAASAAAAPALATNNVNLRQGPGTTYTVIMTIPGGSNVDVGGCSGQWCQVTFQGQNGYAIATSFDQGGGAPPPGAAGPPAGYAGPPAGPPPAGYAPPPTATVPITGPMAAAITIGAGKRAGRRSTSLD